MIEAVEAEFKGHATKNFSIIEAECNTIKTALGGVSVGSGASNSLVAQRVVALEVAMQREVATINGNVQQPKQGIESVPLLVSGAMSTAAVTFGVPVAATSTTFGAPATTSGMTLTEREALEHHGQVIDEITKKLKMFNGKCHCPDVDVLDKRLLLVETQIR